MRKTAHTNSKLFFCDPHLFCQFLIENLGLLESSFQFRQLVDQLNNRVHAQQHVNFGYYFFW